MGYGVYIGRGRQLGASPSLTDTTTGTPALTSSANSAMLLTAGQPSTNTTTTCIIMRTTLEAAEDFGIFTTPQLIAFLAEHGIALSEAEAELGDSAYDAATLCRWIGY